MKATIRAHEQYRWYALAVIMLGTTMGTLDSSIANVAIPTIARVYHHSLDDAEWVVLSFMLVTASTLVLFGRLGDMFGQKRIYLAGFAVFGLSSLACALAPSLGLLIATRAVQALGAAMLVSSNQALIVDTFPSTERGRAIGFNGAAAAAGLSLGPIIGGAIVTFGDWRWIFMINVPVSIIALIGATLVLKHIRGENRGFDPIGALLSIVGLFCISLALSRSHIWGWDSPRTIGLLVFGVAVLVLFIFVERLVKAPTLDLNLFKIRIFAVSLLASLIYFIALSGLIFIVPLAAQTALTYTAFAAGLLLTPITALNVVLAPFAGSLSDRVPARYVSTAGALMVAGGLFLLSRLPPHPTELELIRALIITGCGTAVFSQPNNSAIMGSAPAARRGIAAAMLAESRTSGQLLGVAVASAVYFASAAAHGGEFARTFEPATDYFGFIAFVVLGVAALSWVRE
ncbi:MAG TPA: MFS transporter [Candidatus Baltobacteraceae bacterium]|nr:MFS transporter [Candidatus Baltobacteraceae bacterium]